MGVDVQTCDQDLKTLLHHAAMNGAVTTYKLLLSKDAREDQHDSRPGKRPGNYGSAAFHREIALERIHSVVEGGDVSKLKEWKGNQSDVVIEAFAGIYDGMSILHRAILSGNEEMLTEVRKFESYRQFVNFQDRRGNTPLILAAQKGFIAAIKLLIAPSKLEICNHEGKDALSYALAHREIAIVDPFVPFYSSAVCEDIVRQALLWSALLFPMVSPIQTLWDLAKRSHCLGFRRIFSENLKRFFVICANPGTTPLHDACVKGIECLLKCFCLKAMLWQGMKKKKLHFILLPCMGILKLSNCF